ncbi:hypothetical protein NQ176_g429 [Zarea fungicola]|uniref:Uncharacterized protein n=1 Tax=Zarea fungicola TaxID=93591 RepID=A0ACC1NXD4_9HYPO|nr:hypothetical protein NQ176_g429 [Lecanicillium fungicola]
MDAVKIRIAILNADEPVPAVRAIYPTYGSVFHSLLAKSAARLSDPVSAGMKLITIQSQEFNVVKNEYPSSLEGFDALLITGSAASSYEKLEWVRRLDAYVKDVYTQIPRIKMFGSCFGHQIICQSLLRDYGVRVEKDRQGWELGVHEVQLTDEFINAFITHNKSCCSSLRLQFVHADHVTLTEKEIQLPPEWIPLGRTAHCAFQGIYQPNRVLTLQGHFEFDRFINSETIKVFGAKWDNKELDAALHSMDRDDDAEQASDLVVRFLLEGRLTTES